jgi:hypothetical protein
MKTNLEKFLKKHKALETFNYKCITKETIK